MKRQSGIGGGFAGGASNNGDSVYQACYDQHMDQIDKQIELIEQQESRINEDQIEQQIDRCYTQFCPVPPSGANSGNSNSNACSTFESALDQLENRYDQIESKYDQLFAQLDMKYGGGRA